MYVSVAASCTSSCLRVDERRTSSKCSNDCDCDGKRSCSKSGFCQGGARGPGVCGNTPSYCSDICYKVDEAKSPLGANKCGDACDCDGSRTCSSSGVCEGVARPPGSCGLGIASVPSPPPPPKPLAPLTPCQDITLTVNGARSYDRPTFGQVRGEVTIKNARDTPFQLKGPVQVVISSSSYGAQALTTTADCGGTVNAKSSKSCGYRVSFATRGYGRAGMTGPLPAGMVWDTVRATAEPAAGGQCRSPAVGIPGPTAYGGGGGFYGPGRGAYGR